MFSIKTLSWLSGVETFINQTLRLRSGKTTLVERSRNLVTNNAITLRLASAALSTGRSGKHFLSVTFLFTSLSLLSFSDGMAQHKKIDWPFLAQVEWGEKYFEEYEETVWYPDFSKEVLATDGQLVEIKGYVIPVDVESGYYVLSANPFASCFFCGGAGPESVLELQFPPSMKKVFKTDEIATFQGKLKLNWDDLEHCNYILQNAVPK